MKSTFLFVLTFAVLYGLLMLALFLLQKKLLYFPPPANPVMAEFQTVLHFGSRKTKAWIVHPNKNRALLYYGGNAEAIENNIPLFRQWFPDYAIYLIPYRGYSDTPGTPAEKALFADALEQFDKIKEKHQQVILFGRSLGSGIATYVASNRTATHGVILVTPFDSLKNLARFHYWYAPVGLLIQESYDSQRYAPNIEAETLIIAAMEDRIVPPRFSRKLASAFPVSQLTYHELPNADHHSVIFHPQFAALLHTFLDQLEK